MKQRVLVALVATLTAVPAMGDQILMHTLQNGVLTGWSLHTVNADGLYRIDEGDFVAEASSSSSMTMSSGGANMKYKMGPTRSTTLVDRKAGKIAEVGQNDHCRVMSKDSRLPTGGMAGVLGGEDMQRQRQEMATAAAGANARLDQVIAEMKAQGATPEQIAMVAGVQAAMGGAVTPQAQTDDSLQLQPLNSSVDFNGLKAMEYMAVNAMGEPRFRFAVVDIDDLPGAALVKEGILWTIDTYESIMQNAMGGGMPMGDNFTAVMKEPQLNGTFPVVINELRKGEENKVFKAVQGDAIKEVQLAGICKSESDMFDEMM